MSKLKKAELKQLMRHLKPFKMGILGAWFLLLATIFMRLPMPLLTMYLIDNVLVKQDTQLLNTLCIGLMAFLLLQAFISFWQRRIIIKIQNKVVKNIRSHMYENIIRAKLKFFDKMKTGDLVSRLTNDVGKLQGLMADTIVAILSDSLTIVVGAVVLLWLHWKLALVSMAVVPLYLIAIRYFNRNIRKISATVQTQLAELTSALFESFIGVYYVKAFGTTELEVKRTNNALVRVHEEKAKLDTIGAASGIVANFITAIGRFILIWYGLSEIKAVNLTIG